MNTVRAFCFLANVLKQQQSDALCGNCKAWVNSVTAAREKLGRFEAEHAADLQLLPPEIAAVYSRTKAMLHSLTLPPGLSGQKKAGNCLLPQGVCFVKSSLAILDKM